MIILVLKLLDFERVMNASTHFFLCIYEHMYASGVGNASSRLRTMQLRHTTNIGLMLVNRLRRWTKIKPILILYLLFAGYWGLIRYHPFYITATLYTVHTPAVQRQTAVTAYLKSKQLLLFVLARLIIVLLSINSKLLFFTYRLDSSMSY